MRTGNRALRFKFCNTSAPKAFLIVLFIIFYLLFFIILKNFLVAKKRLTAPSFFTIFRERPNPSLELAKWTPFLNFVREIRIFQTDFGVPQTNRRNRKTGDLRILFEISQAFLSCGSMLGFVQATIEAVFLRSKSSFRFRRPNLHVIPFLFYRYDLLTEIFSKPRENGASKVLVICISFFSILYSVSFFP